MRGLDGDLQALVILGVRRRWATEPRIETAARYFKDAAQETKRVVESLRFHERVPGSDSLAKYAVAFLK
jgi:hypothetical protein